MSAEAAFVQSWQVGRWKVTLSVPSLVAGGVRHAVAEWEPNLPGRRLTASEQFEYDQGLCAAIAAFERMRHGL